MRPYVTTLLIVLTLAAGCNSSAKRDAAEITFLQKRIESMESAPRPYEEKTNRLLSRVSQLSDSSLAECGLYRVQRSDTLAVIARKFGITVRDIAIWNVITNPARVQVGDILIVSEKEPNQRPERNAGAASPSTSESTPGVAHP